MIKNFLPECRSVVSPFDSQMKAWVEPFKTLSAKNAEEAQTLWNRIKSVEAHTYEIYVSHLP
jgi:hypothetical protein